MNPKLPKEQHIFKRVFRVGRFLAYRDLKRASRATTGLIIAIMTLTFLNLVVVSGILVGLIESSVNAQKARYTGDIIISPYQDKKFIDHTKDVLDIVKTVPGYVGYTSRYTAGGTTISNYRDTLTNDEKLNSTAGLIAGIDPVAEDAITHISNKVVEGSFLEVGDTDSIVIGADLLYKYTPIESPGFSTLKNVDLGSRVLIKVGDAQKEFIIKGIIKSKVGDVDQRIYMLDSELRKLIGNVDFNVEEIAIQITPTTDPVVFKQDLVASGVATYGRVQTAEEAQPKFLQQIKQTFALLGNMISAIGLVVASITIFIVIFVNAITRRRFIGILKGVGIMPAAIEISYVLQAMFFAAVGTIIGSTIVFGFLKPYFDTHPINFPFSDGTLAVTVGGAMIRVLVLFIATLIAGYIPARKVCKQNTLDAILGR